MVIADFPLEEIKKLCMGRLQVTEKSYEHPRRFLVPGNGPCNVRSLFTHPAPGSPQTWRQSPWSLWIPNTFWFLIAN